MSRSCLSLAIAAVYILLVFGLPTLKSWRINHTTGFHGLSGRVGSLPWLGGFGFVAAFALVLAAPLLEWTGSGPLLATPTFWVDLVAFSLMSGGTLGTLWSQSAMGASWRVGVDDDETTTLVKHGPFRWVRNPVFTFIAISVCGFATFLPTIATIAATGVLLFSLQVQVRVVEEPYLRETHGDAYQHYEVSTGRFLPVLVRKNT